MKTLFTTVSDDRAGRKGGKYSSSQDNILRLIKRYPEFGIDTFAFWKRRDVISTSFYRDNKRMLDHPDPDMNGRCYKPFVIVEGLKSIQDGDFLIYNDVSPEMWNDWISIDADIYDLDVIKQLCVDNGGILSSNSHYNGSIIDHTHENFTSERCINKMGLQKYKYSLQHASGMIVLQKSKKSMDFAEEWLHWNLIDECASLGPVFEQDYGKTAAELNAYVNLCSSFTYWNEEVIAGYGKLGHRHDQSISGLLLNRMDNRLVKQFAGYCFLNFCRKDKEYEFVDSNQSPSPNRLKIRHYTKDGTDGIIDVIERSSYIGV